MQLMTLQSAMGGSDSVASLLTHTLFTALPKNVNVNGRFSDTADCELSFVKVTARRLPMLFFNVLAKARWAVCWFGA
jgi:hypothetical protein